MKKPATKLFYLLTSIISGTAASATLKEGDAAPDFTIQTHENRPFHLADRKAQGWTVLYFYPKAETPGCTKQACAFRDSIKGIRAKNAEVFGISTDTVESQKKFHEHHHLSFTLLADPDARVTDLYGARMPIVKFAKRWTFLIDPELKIRRIERDVDPVKDPDFVVHALEELGAK